MRIPSSGEQRWGRGPGDYGRARAERSAFKHLPYKRKTRLQPRSRPRAPSTIPVASQRLFGSIWEKHHNHACPVCREWTTQP